MLLIRSSLNTSFVGRISQNQRREPSYNIVAGEQLGCLGNKAVFRKRKSMNDIFIWLEQNFL